MFLKEVLPFIEENSTDIKIHFARGSKIPEEALQVFLAGEFKPWQEHQNKRNFEKPYILSLIRLGNWEWLFVGIYESKGCKEQKDGSFVYKTKLTNIGADLIGKAIIHFKRDFRQSYCLLENHIDSLELLEIRRNEYSKPFPGYDKVCISWGELYTVINIESWKTALSNLKGVYLITDTKNGKLYVGSATGDEMIWGRWIDYINTGHGGNKDLKKLGKSYIQENFQYTILDVYKPGTDDQEILDREEWWKGVLKSKEFGNYNN